MQIGSRKKILIIDDHALFADGLSLLLRKLGSLVEVSVCTTVEEGLAKLPHLNQFDLALVDLHLPGVNGMGFLTAVKSQKITLPIAVISGTVKKHEIERVLSEGAAGFIPKDSPSDEMLRAVTVLLAGNRYLPDKWFGEINWLDHDEPNVASELLTGRQLEVLRLVADGLQNKQIASVLGITLSAVKGHIEKIFKALNVNNRTRCVQKARDEKLV